MNSTEQYLIKWDSYHSHLINFFSNLYESEILTDVSIYVEGHVFRCHKVILVAASSYFQDILYNNPSKHPVIILSGMKVEDIKAIMSFIYKGELGNIDYEHFISILKAAEYLKIQGLTEIISYIPSRCSDVIAATQERLLVVQDAKDDFSGNLPISDVTCVTKEECLGNPDLIIEKEIHQKDIKKYSEGNLYKALKDMEKGMSLSNASLHYKIPRSTLYLKAKHSGLSIAKRREHSSQECHAAIQAVAKGMSLKRASEQFNIPKTVLWRRVQKSLDVQSKSRFRKGKGISDKLNKMSSQSIIATTGNQDISSSEEKESSRFLKQTRLSQAVAACKSGQMSHATASITFQVPKTTIWRRLQKSPKEDNIIDTSDPNLKKRMEDHHYFISVEEASHKILFEGDKEESINYIASTDLSESTVSRVVPSMDSDHIVQNSRKETEEMDILKIEIANNVEIKSDNT